MITVWEFVVPTFDVKGKVRDRCLIEMPQGAEILAFQTQGPEFCIWALVDDMAPKHRRAFQLVGTEQKVPSDRIEGGGYIGTIQSAAYVWHLFEVVYNPVEGLVAYATRTRGNL